MINNKDVDFRAWLSTEFVTDEVLVDTKKMKLFTDYTEFAVSSNRSVMSLPTFNLVMKDYLTEKELVHSYDRVRKSTKFNHEGNASDNEVIEYIKNNKTVDLSDSLDELRLDLNVIAKSVNKNGKNLLITYGRPGISKTETVKDTLKELKVDYAYIRVNDIKNTGDFYKILYKNNGRVLLFDDSDVILKKGSPIGAMMLSATDTMISNRRLTYFNTTDTDILKASEKDDPSAVAKKIPQQFVFSGCIINITNLPLPRMNTALTSRAILNEVDACDDSIVNEIEKHIEDKFNEYTVETKRKALDFLISLRTEGVIKDIDFRYYVMILQYTNSDFNFEVVKPIIVKKLLKIIK